MDTNFYELRAFPNGKDQYSTFKKGKFVAIGWPEVPDLLTTPQPQVREILTKEHPDYDATKIGQILGFFSKMRDMKRGDIILIPYVNDEGPIITVAQVTKEYYYSKKHVKSHMSHKVGIKILTDMSRSAILDKSKDLSLSLNARLTLTTLNKKKHKEALAYIQKKAVNSKKIARFTGDTNSISKTYETLRKEYNENITILKNKINSSSDDLIIRALLFSALTLQETLVKTFIIKKIISENVEVFDIIIDELQNRKTRDKIIDIYFDAPDTIEDYIALRNALAHNINSTKVLVEKKQILNKEPDDNGEERKAMFINTIFDHLLKYSTDFIEKSIE